MADEIVSVGIKIEATGADKAASQLDALATKGAKVEASTGKIEAGAAKAGKSLESMGGSANSAAASSERLAQAGQKLGTAFAAASAALGVGQLIQTSDAYTKLTAQLRLATTGQTEYANAYANVSRIATAAQSDLAGTAVLYARITSATRELGVAQSQVAAITETVSLALKVSGAGAAESASAMLQLSQAFASGVLRGEEFNAVNEAAPRLMKALADGIGVSVGALRGLAEQGKLTSELLATALPKALEGLRGEAKEVENIAGAFTLLKNSFTEFVGQQSQASGAAALLAQGIGLVAKNLDLVAAAALGYAGAKVANLLLQTGAAAASSTAALLQQAAAQNAAKAAAVQAAQAQTATAAANIATANATQVAIVSARADAVAQLERANATLAASRASIAAATAAGAQSAALAVLRGASIAAAEADTARAAAMSALAVLGRQQASVTTQLAAANTALVASQTATAAAAAGAAGAATLASRALTLLGGPIGVITTLLGVGVTAWFAWGAAAKSGEQSAAGAMEKSTGEIISALDSQIAKLKERNALAAGGVPSIAKGNDESSQRAASLFSQAMKVQRGELNPELDSAGRGQFVQDLLRQYGELVTRIQAVKSEQQKLDDTGKQSKLSEYMTKYATSAESAAAAIKKAREELGSAFTPELERRIREHFIKPVTSGADKSITAARAQDAKSYETIIKSLLAVQAKFSEETVKTSAAQEVLNKAIAEGAFSSLPETYQKAILEMVKYTEGIENQAEAMKNRAAIAADAEATIAKAMEAEWASLDALDKSIASERERVAVIGLTREQIEMRTLAMMDGNIAAKESELADIQLNDTGSERIRILGEEIKKLKELRGLQAEGAQKQQAVDWQKQISDTAAADAKKAKSAQQKAAEDAAKEWEKASDQISQGLTDALFRAAEAGKGFFQTLKESLIGMFNNLILKPVIQYVVKSALGGLGGALGLVAPAGAQGGVGGQIGASIGNGIMNALGGVGGLIKDGYQWFSNTALGGMLTGAGRNAAGLASSVVGELGFSSATSTAASLASSTAGELGFSAATSAGSAAGSTGIMGVLGSIPVWGWAAMAAVAVAAIFGGKGGGPKSGGSAIVGGNGTDRLFTPVAADTELRATVDAALVTVNDFVKSVGGVFNGSVALGFDIDPEGTAQARVASRVTRLDGSTVYDNSGGREVGRDMEDVKRELGNETSRLILAALQASNLGNGFTEFFNRLDVETATPEQINNLISLASTLRQVGENAKLLPGAMGALANSSAAAREKILSLVGGIDRLNQLQQSYFQNFFSPEEQLAQMRTNAGATFQNMGLSFEALLADPRGPIMAFRALVEGLKDASGQIPLENAAAFAALQAANPEVVAFVNAANQVRDAARTAAAAIRGAADSIDQAFLSEADYLAKAMRDLGFAMPQTAAEFEALVRAQDTTTESGRNTIAALLGLKASFDSVEAAAREAANATIRLALESSRTSVTTEMDALTRANGDLTQTLFELENPIQTTAERFLELGQSMQDTIDRMADILGTGALSLLDQLQARVNTRTAITGARVGIAGQIQDQQIQGFSNRRDFRGGIDFLKGIEAALFAELETTTDPAGVAGQITQAMSTRYQFEASLIQEADDLRRTSLEKEINRLEALIDIADRLRDTIVDLQTGSLSALAPQAQVTVAASSFNSVLGRAQGGDVKALQALPSEATRYLTESQSFNASGGDYASVFSGVIDSLSAVGVSLSDAPTQLGLAQSQLTATGTVVDNTGAMVVDLRNLDTALAARSTTETDGINALVIAIRDQIAADEREREGIAIERGLQANRWSGLATTLESIDTSMSTLANTTTREAAA